MWAAVSGDSTRRSAASGVGNSPAASGAGANSTGGTRRPSLASGVKATVICSGVTATPCPIGIRVRSVPDQDATGRRIPPSSPGNPEPVGRPRPWARSTRSSSVAPISSITFPMPMFELWTSTSSQVSFPCGWASRRTGPRSGFHQPASVQSMISSGSARPISVAAAHTSGLTTEPGSKTSVTTRLRRSSGSVTPASAGSKRGRFARARTSPLRGSSTTIWPESAP